MQHRELFRLEVAGRQSGPALDMRLELGARVTYDLNRGVFGLRSDNWKRPSVAPAITSGLNPTELQKRLPSRPLEDNGSKRDALIHARPAFLVTRDVASASAPHR